MNTEINKTFEIMQLDKYNTRDLNIEELTIISGGHKGFWYGVGEGFMDSTLLIMGVMAGLYEGLTK